MKRTMIRLLAAAMALGGGTRLLAAPVRAETAPTVVGVPDGALGPWARAMEAPDRSMYGTTYSGGDGTIFEVAPAGGTRLVYHFPNRTDGTGTDAPVIQGSDGRLYGTTYYDGGPTRCGTVYAINPDGSGYTVLHTFADSDGCNPTTGLVQADNGYLYGTTSGGGPNHLGGIFRIAPDGSGYTVLHMFTNVNEASNPRAGLIEGQDGHLYGTTFGGGARGGGIVFSIAPDGSGFTTIYALGRTPSDGGANPRSGLVQGADGALYGTTSAGGQYGQGSVFKVTLSGTFTVLHTFPAAGEGKSPHAELLLASDGRLYGTASHGGPKDLGIVFSLGTDGSGYTVVHGFVGGASDGSVPEAALMQADDGTLVGTASAGGAKNSGVLYRLNLNLAKPAPTARSFAPHAGPTGTSILVHGSYFVGTTGVTVGGVPATYTVMSSEWIKATVPANAVSGPVSIATAGGTIDAGHFTVSPTVATATPGTGDVGQRVVLAGTGFAGVTTVSFSGAKAPFSIDSPTQITTTVPSGATTGPITVATSEASATSPFFVFTGRVQPTPTATVTTSSTPTPTSTATTPASISIETASIAHNVKGKMVGTGKLKSGKQGTFSLTYSARNAGTLQPAATLAILKNGKETGAATPMEAAAGGFSITRSFRTRKPMVLTARFTVTLGSSQDTRSVTFRVTPK